MEIDPGSPVEELKVKVTNYSRSQHFHYTSLSNYKRISLLGCRFGLPTSWSPMTELLEALGLR